ncbi:MAG TPA: response regulator [Polaromonas sp.]|uniref:response regulator n=1 Tax=Polaromonas sp. TaxID=1869339 RepID=UPI002D4296A3|nr:response regulator [Polaromonas sp.]HYW58204.1 response regulator [Polaromonas sp.]
MTDNSSTFRHIAPEPAFGLAESQRRMQQQLMESTGVAQSVFNLKTQQLNWNNRAYEMFGVSPVGTVMTLETAMDLVYPDDLEMVVKARDQLRKVPGALELDYRIIRPDGGLLDVHTMLYAETDGQGRPLAYVELSLDVTERKRVENALIHSARLCRVLDKVATDGYWEQAESSDSGYREETIPAPLAANPVHSGPQRKMRILYVEDNMYNLMLFDDVMRTREDVDMRMAQNGAQGYEVAATWQPDVLVIDGRLPDTHGIDLLKRLRELPGLESTPAFMCSADTLPEHKIVAEQAGFTGYWTKPVDFDKVFDELDRVAATTDLR